ncbi:UbiA prenyltransferase [Candidatus Velamenicoccus archaeovorus]|uniref:UbiA prenyltransferase n=1 Tax=Velamenicoccus archaeovorus TaxID=1930593 RepID=A0A410P4N7_VELA1|nr:prenyltransferase [Candidatus Velamenicoccus archaeovorus]QAT16944.1 UbiA prenyltransferase [Candidatus Velamenicoccus archaeovorus]
MSLPGRFLTVIRGWSLPLSISSVTLGTTAAATTQRGSAWLYLLVVFGVCLFHACANTFNDYFDLKYGVDTPEAPTAIYRAHGVFAGLIAPKALFYLSIILLTIALLIGAALAILRTAYLWPLIILGLFLNLFYTALPGHALKYTALGEPAVFLAFGPVIMEGSFAVQTGYLSWNVFLLSLPVGILVALVLFANNLRDREFDSCKKIKTLATLLGPRAGMKTFIALAYLPYMITGAYVGMKILDWPGLFVLFSLPTTVRTVRSFSQNIPVAADAMASETALSFNFFLLISLIINILIKI